MASATSKQTRLDEDGKPIPRDKEDDQRSYQRAREQAVLDDEDGFEVVTEKKKRTKRIDDDDFGGGMPQFSRGNRKDQEF